MTTQCSQLIPASPAPDQGPGAGSPACVVAVTDGTGRLSRSGSECLNKNVPAALRHLGVTGDLSVRLVDDIEMAAAHLEYLEQTGTTDVITFELTPTTGGPHPVLDVDMLACLDEAARQGATRGHPPERELLLYIIHGVLHCLGFDDHDPAAAQAMHAREDQVLRAIGIGDTFRAPGGEP